MAKRLSKERLKACQDAIKSTNASSIEIETLLAISAVKTGCDPKDTYTLAEGAWRISPSIHGPVPESFQAQANQALGVLRGLVDSLYHSGSIDWYDPVFPPNEETSAETSILEPGPFKDLDFEEAWKLKRERFIRNKAQAIGVLAIAWDRPVLYKDTIKRMIGQNKLRSTVEELTKLSDRQLDFADVRDITTMMIAYPEFFSSGGPELEKPRMSKTTRYILIGLGLIVAVAFSWYGAKRLGSTL